MAEEKTNVMRILEQKKIPYRAHYYPHAEGQAVPGAAVAALLGQPPAAVFKTLVAVGASRRNYVFVIPVLCTLDRKKAAKAVGERSVELIPVKELAPLTGYVRGGCSPVGMKKALPAVFDASALQQRTVCVSAGRIGAQIECDPAALIALVRARTAPLTEAPSPEKQAPGGE